MLSGFGAGDHLLLSLLIHQTAQILTVGIGWTQRIGEVMCVQAAAPGTLTQEVIDG